MAQDQELGLPKLDDTTKDLGNPALAIVNSVGTHLPVELYFRREHIIEHVGLGSSDDDSHLPLWFLLLLFTGRTVASIGTLQNINTIVDSSSTLKCIMLSIFNWISSRY